MKVIPARPAYLETKGQSTTTHNPPRREADIHICGQYDGRRDTQSGGQHDSQRNDQPGYQHDEQPSGQHGGSQHDNQPSVQHEGQHDGQHDDQDESQSGDQHDGQTGNQANSISSPRELSSDPIGAEFNMTEHLQQLLSAAEGRTAKEVVTDDMVNDGQECHLPVAQHCDEHCSEPGSRESAQTQLGIEDREHTPIRHCSQGPHSPLQEDQEDQTSSRSCPHSASAELTQLPQREAIRIPENAMSSVQKSSHGGRPKRPQLQPQQPQRIRASGDPDAVTDPNPNADDSIALHGACSTRGRTRKARLLEQRLRNLGEYAQRPSGSATPQPRSRSSPPPNSGSFAEEEAGTSGD